MCGRKTVNGAYRYRYAPFLMLCQGTGPWLSPWESCHRKVTERALQPFLNLMPTYYVKGFSPVVLPLGELSPQVTERGLRPFLNDNIIGCCLWYGHCLPSPSSLRSATSPKGRGKGCSRGTSKGEARCFPGFGSPSGTRCARPPLP